MDTGFGRRFNEHIKCTIERFQIRRVTNVPVYECHAFGAQPVHVPFGSSTVKVIYYDNSIGCGMVQKIPRQGTANEPSATPVIKIFI